MNQELYTPLNTINYSVNNLSKLLRKKTYTVFRKLKYFNGGNNASMQWIYNGSRVFMTLDPINCNTVLEELNGSEEFRYEGI